MKTIGLGTMEYFARVRNNMYWLPYGDQTLWCHREMFEKLGRFPNTPFMEDFELVRRARQFAVQTGAFLFFFCVFLLFFFSHFNRSVAFIKSQKGNKKNKKNTYTHTTLRHIKYIKAGKIHIDDTVTSARATSANRSACTSSPRRGSST